VSIEVKLLDSRDCWKPGETVKAEVTWQDEEGAEELEVSVLWSTRGRGDEDKDVVATESIHAPGSSGSRRVEFDLPQGPWSYRGKMIEIVWQVDAVIWPSGLESQADLVLSPTGSILAPIAQDPNDPTLTKSEKKAQSMIESVQGLIEKYSHKKE